jgi:hypothetical protein
LWIFPFKESDADEMPAIGTLTLCTSVSQLDTNSAPTPAAELTADFARKDEAQWRSAMAAGGGESSRTLARLTRRGPVGQSDLIKYTFHVKIPTMKSVVSEGVPYEAPPVLDYYTAAEISVWCHPRATETERSAALAAVLGDTTSLQNLLFTTMTEGESVY